MENYSYRLLAIDDLPQLNELFNAAFDTSVHNDFLKWKYFSNPVGNALLAGAFYEGKLVGSGAMIVESMNFFGKQEIVYKCTDLMTHPEHQRKGLSKKINELLFKTTLEKHTPFSYTLCSKISTKSFLKNNWLFISGVVNFFKPRILLKITSLFQKPGLQSIRFLESVDSNLDNYPFTVNPSVISVYKTPAFLKWRTANLYFRYKMICHYDSENNINGYLIYSISKNNLLNVIDIEAKDEDKKIINRLLRSAEYITVKDKYKGIMIMAIRDTAFYNFIRSRKYLHNPFHKGPLQTILDFDICIHRTGIDYIKDTGVWNIYGLSYDDI